MDNSNLGYLAGLIDGEGSIMLPKPTKYSLGYPCIQVSSTDIEVLEWLRDNFGGIILNKKVYKDYHKQSYTWSLKGNKAIELLTKILPYLKIKRKIERAKILVMEYPSLTPRNGYYTPELRKQKEEMIARFLSIK